jgi:hypothetical protein
MRAKRILRVAGLGLIGCLTSAIPVHGSIIYNYYYTAGQDSYTLAPGSDLTVELYLQEANSDQSSNSLLGSEHGLSAAGVNVSRLSGSTLTTLTGAAPNAGIPGSGFDDPASTGTLNSSSSATITESTDPPPFGSDVIGVEAGTQANGVSEVFLGTVTIHASLIGGQSTAFSVGIADPSLGTTFTNDNSYDLDNNADPLDPSDSQRLYNSSAETAFTVTTAVPEPAALTLFTIAGFLLTRCSKQRVLCER